MHMYLYVYLDPRIKTEGLGFSRSTLRLVLGSEVRAWTAGDEARQRDRSKKQLLLRDPRLTGPGPALFFVRGISVLVEKRVTASLFIYLVIYLSR